MDTAHPTLTASEPAWLAPEALETAFQHVAHNGGCAGADGETIAAFAPRREPAFSRLRAAVLEGAYRPLPLLPITIQKRSGSPGTRTLLVPTVRDRILQTAAGRLLGRAFEDDFLECSFAYRPHRGVDSAIARLRFWHERGYTHIAEADIDSFFDRIAHDDLTQRLRARISDPLLCHTLAAWIACPAWDGAHALPRSAGIPQGSPISPLLANFFLNDFNLTLEAAGLKVIRYADDFLILAKEGAEASRGLVIARDQLEALHLALKSSKTRVATFEEGFHFLGVYFLGPDIWIPWKRDNRSRHVLAVPRPMRPAELARWLHPPPPTALAHALAHARQISPHPPLPATLQGDEMAVLYLTAQGAILRKIGNRLVVEKDDTILLDTPYHKLDAVLLFGNIQITTQAMAEIMDHGIPLSLLSRQGAIRGSLEPAAGKNIPLRMRQFELHADADRALALARTLIANKLANAATVLERFGDRDIAASSENAAAVQQIRQAQQQAASAPTLDTLNGIEGRAARVYYDALMRRNKSALPWPGRIKHPATDPINALLSFGYTLVANELAGLVEGLGLDSYLGVLHQLDYGRRSLAYDLIEAFRAPLIDRFVLTLLNRKQCTAADLETLTAENDGTAAGLVLRPASAKLFLREYENWMLHSPLDREHHGFRPLLRAEAEAWAVQFRPDPNARPFAPYTYKE